MRKRLAGILICILCMLAYAPTALAEEVRVTVTASQTELSDSGNVTFTFNISNFSDYELSDIVIVYNGASHTELQDTVVPPNQSIQDYKLELPVSEAQLGAPIQFTISCVRNGEPITAEASVTIARSSDPVISLTREADATTVRQGESVKLTYALKNETKFDMTDIQVIDQEISDIPQKLQLLRAGGTMSWDWSRKMDEDDVLSAPTVTYTVNGKTKSFSGVESLTLTALLVRLDMRVDAGTPTAAGVNFTLEIKNTGNQEIKDIVIKDERGNSVNTAPFSLAAEESATYSYLVVPVMTEASREVKFTLSGTDTLAQPYSLTTPESYPVYPFVDESQINVQLTAETVTPWTSETGKIVARVVIVNRSLVELTNVSVLETGNVLKTYDTLQSGETSSDFEIILGSPRNLQFTLKGADPTGAMRELAAGSLPVAYGTEAADASPSPEQITAGGNMQAFSFLSSTISKILVALGILMVLSFVVLIALSIAERNRAGGVRFDDDNGEDDLDDFFRETAPERRSYYDDRDEVQDYTARMQSAVPRRAQEMNAPPIPLPPPSAQPPQVTVEYDAAPYGAQPPAGAYAETPYRTPAVTQQPLHGYAEPPTERVRHGAANVYPETAFMQPPQYETPPQPAYPPQQPERPFETPQQPYVTPPTFAQTPQYNPPQTAAQETAYYPPPPAREEAFAPYAAGEQEPYYVPGAQKPPKVIVNKRRPAVQPQRRNEVRHVHKDPQK